MRSIRSTITAVLSFTILLLLQVSCGKPAVQEKRNIVIMHNLSHHDESFYTFQNIMLATFPDTSRYNLTFVAVTEAYYKWLDEDFGYLVKEKLDLIRERGTNPPIILFYSDQVAHAAARLDDPILDSLPCAFFGVSYPEYQNLLKSRKNFTGYTMNMDFAKNLDFMRDMGVRDWVVTNLDGSYLDNHLKTMIVEQLSPMEDKYVTNLDLSQQDHYVEPQFRDSSRLTLIPVSLQDTDRNWIDREKGLGFSTRSMLQCKDRECTFLRVKDDKWGIEALSHPLGAYFAMTPERFDMNYHGALNACIGGYFPSMKQIAADMATVVKEVVEQGKSPADIPWREHKNEYWLDWRVAKVGHVYANELPSYAKVVNLPFEDRSSMANLLSNFGLEIALAGLWLIIATAAFSYSSSNRKKEAALLKEGDQAERNLFHLSETLSATEGFFFRINQDEGIHFNGDIHNALGSDTTPTTVTEFAEMMEPSDRKSFISFVRNEHNGRKTKDMTIKIHGNREGEEHLLDMRLCSSASPNGGRTVTGLIFVIDYAMKIDAERAEAYKVEEQSTIKRAFLTSMGHEIRTPLNAIVGYSRLIFEMYDDLTEEEKEQYTEIITKNTDQILALIDNVITYSEESGKEPEIKLSKKKVSTLVDELYMTYRVIVPKHIDFKLIKGDEDDYIMVNRGSMLQIVSNLMNNAVKFTEKGSITLGWKHENENDIAIFVEDTGCGMAEDFMSTLFTKYTKESASTEGAGIGLALCKKLVDKLEGHIVVSSTLGEGSRFEVVFPKVS